MYELSILHIARLFVTLKMAVCSCIVATACFHMCNSYFLLLSASILLETALKGTATLMIFMKDLNKP